MKPGRWWMPVMLAVIVAAGAALRLTGLNWDEDEHYHPDERYISWVATTLSWPTTWRDAFHPQRSTFNPYWWPPEAHSAGIVVPQGEPRDFAYGHLPLYLGVAATRLMTLLAPSLLPHLPPDAFLATHLLNGRAAIEFDHLTLVGRALTALFDVGSIILVYIVGRQLFRPAVGLLAAAFLALNGMHIQLAHFFASDPYQTFFVVATVAALLHALSGRTWALGVAAVCLGLAVGSKFGAIFLLLPLALTVYWWGAARGASGRRRVVALAACGALALGTFAVTNPFALLDFTCEALTPAVSLGPLHLPAINWKSCYLMNIAKQSGMASGQLDLAFTRQYLGTWPFLYHVDMQLRWGMGLPLGILAWGGFAWAAGRAGQLRHRLSRRSSFQPFTSGAYWVRPGLRPEWVVLAWTLPFFLSTGGLLVKFMRYMQPLTPFLMVYAAAWVLSWRWRPARWAAVTLTLTATALYALAFVQLYQQLHPWLAASAWLYQNAPPGSSLVTEQWDHQLPSGITLDGQRFSAGIYHQADLTWLTGADEQDTPAKLQANLVRLAQADYLIVASNRVYGVTPTLPERYPLSSRVYPLLFDGTLGYELAYVNSRGPQLGGYWLKPDTFGRPGLTPPAGVAAYLDGRPGLTLGFADESFTVYDQPLVMIFRNVERLPAETLFNLITAGDG